MNIRHNTTRSRICVAFIGAAYFAGCSRIQPKPTHYQSDAPVTREVAQPFLRVELPTGAKNVRYAVHYHWQAMVELIRFEAPLDEALAFARSRRGNEMVKELNISTSTPDQLMYPENVSPLAAPWFTPDRIRKGVFVGAGGSHQPCVWIDEDNSNVYYYCAD